MSTGTTIIKRALQKIGAASAVSEPSAEAMATGFDTLNSMISSWTSRGIMTGATRLNVAGDELNEKEDCRNAIISNLAVKISPDFDNGKNIVSPTLRAEANGEFAIIKALYQTFTIPQKVVSSTLPKGQGTDQSYYDEVYFATGNRIGN